MDTTVTVSRVRDGDDALILAADGVLGMFSVGVNPTEFHYDDDVLVRRCRRMASHRPAAVRCVRRRRRHRRRRLSTHPNRWSTSHDRHRHRILTPPPATPSPAGRRTRRARRSIPVTPPRPAPPPLTLQRVAELVAAREPRRDLHDAVHAAIEGALTNVTTTDIGASCNPPTAAKILDRSSTTAPR